MRPSRFVRFLLVSIALFSNCSIAAAQTYTPALPDNALTPADPIGIPPQPTTAGTHEAVSNTNGALSFFLPALSLPQRGGWNLTLGYYNTSPNWTMRQDSSTQIIVQQGGAPTLTNINYNNNIVLYAAGGPLSLNLPTLQASIEYAGQIVTATNLDGSPAAIAPVVCITNWVFTDWAGNRHPFTNLTECSAISEHLVQVTDSSDGSWLRLDTTNYHSDITVRTKDGATYHFPGWPSSGDPFAACNTGSSCYGGGAWAPTSGNSYNRTFSSMVDTTGQNTVSYSYTNGMLTDTIGRQITVSSGGITYKDANGNTETISTTLTQQAQQTYNFSVTCSQGKFVPNLTVRETYGPMSFPEKPWTYMVTLPAVNGVSRVYTLQFDGLGNLLQVNYPAGGYTKYDYQDFYFYLPSNLQSCSRTEHQVFHRRECPFSSGACSSPQELVTTYSPSPDGSLPFNDSISIQDALGDVTYVQNQNLAGYPFTAPHETTRKIYAPGQSTPLRTIQTSYTTYVSGLDVQVPASVTTTLNDVSPALSEVTNYQYQTVTMSIHCFSECTSWTPSAPINNATEIDEYDYGASSPTKKTAQTWMTTSNGSLYDIAGGHLLDRLATRTITDPVSTVQSTLSYGYNSVGDITSKTVGGTGLTSLITNYQRDTYGNITQVTDPKGNITRFGYTDTWAQTTCAPASNSSVYLTTITDALNHVTNFSYNSCTGSKASATDPNGDRTSIAYDALGRTTSVNYPDGGQTTTTYVDSVPNSATTSTLVASGLSLVSNIIVDGFGRTSQTQLPSDPDGITYAGTTYDALGRTATVSNPYRTSNDPGPTNGITSFFYDALGRTCLVAPPDGTPPAGGVCPTTQPSNTIFTSYSGNTTTVTDQAGKSRKSVSDALGRLTQVVEDPAGLAYVTNYGYDAFGNLKSVVQNGSRQRNFVYDALSRLTSATNPESGNIAYAYDADSNLVTKTSPAPNQTGAATVSTAYSYDALNRRTGKTYSDGTLPVAYFFDGQAPPSTNSSGSGTVTINGSEQTSPGTYATGTISFSGIASTPTQTVSVGGHTCTFNFPQGTPTNNIATSVANCLNGTGIVTAKLLSNQITLTSIISGTAGNYSLSWSGFSGSISGMSGGTNGTPDSGTVSVTVNGFTKSVSYGSGTAGNTIASALVTAFNGDTNSPVTASSSSNVLTLTAKASGSTSNYSLSASYTYNTSLFQSPSFVPAAFGFSLTGGCNADSLTVTNGVGRRTGMCDAAGSEAWSFDPMGRVAVDRRTTNGLSNTFSYTYNLDGSQLTEVHPINALTINFQQGGAGRPVSESSTDASYAYNVHYAPNGSLCYMNSAWGNTFTHIWTFNSRWQPARIQLYGTGHGSSSPLCSASTDGVGSNLDLSYSFVDASGHNNGNVATITNNIDTDRTQSFTYDPLNRLSSARTAGTNQPAFNGDTDYLQECWGEQFGYDPWGNLLTISGVSSAYTGCTQESLSVSANTKNQVSNDTYDSAGNLISIPGVAAYTFNAENQLVSAGGLTYGYDGDGKRVTKAPSSTPTQPNKIYWYGAGSTPVIETDGAGNFQYRYIFFNGMRVSREEANDSVDHYGLDALGNVRFVYGHNGSWDVSDYYPFGGERVLQSQTGNTYKFTGKERDSESGLDNFGARFDSSSFGRFMSPDWAGYPEAVPYAELTDPRSLNLYSYTQNNPLNMVDYDGHDDIPNPAAKCGLLCRIATFIASLFYSPLSPDQSARQEHIQSPLPSNRGGTLVWNDPEAERAAIGRMITGGRQITLPTPGQNTIGPPNGIIPLPMNVIRALQLIDALGSALPGTKGGAGFNNDGRGGGEVLPRTDAEGNPIAYKEWDVNPPGSGGRDAERIVTGSDGSAYYTGDHYKTFKKIR